VASPHPLPLEGTGLGLSDFGVVEALLHKGPLPVNTIGPIVDLTPGSMRIGLVTSSFRAPPFRPAKFLSCPRIPMITFCSRSGSVGCLLLLPSTRQRPLHLSAPIAGAGG
jgi:hypothetical protein